VCPADREEDFHEQGRKQKGIIVVEFPKDRVNLQGRQGREKEYDPEGKEGK